MTNRITSENIVDYLHNFNENHFREGRHSSRRRKLRHIEFEKIKVKLKTEMPIDIEQQEIKKFALTYYFNENYNIYIVIALKDKFINIVTQHIISKKIGEF
ncbi:MAG: hypothetical protein ISP01_07390 [Methanobrevibacter arboriphilus]|uniref:Uncharacterized protein n=1 Tax=Methanobrevibacter arboriphilus TaxID=39441 RepID=A0A843AJJ4_METAZ|nr:hypothetical protein [Methanobrevibacter arboriphilus]MBF4469215.1 hypothetical protein [Methanobrevibacter arboriphilus]